MSQNNRVNTSAGRSLSSKRGHRDKKEVISSELMHSLANQTLRRLEGMDQPFRQASRKQFACWISEKIVDKKVIKRRDHRRDLGFRVVDMLLSGRMITIKPCGNGRTPVEKQVVVRITDAGKMHLLGMNAHPSTGSVKVQESPLLEAVK